MRIYLRSSGLDLHVLQAHNGGDKDGWKNKPVKKSALLAFSCQCVYVLIVFLGGTIRPQSPLHPIQPPHIPTKAQIPSISTCSYPLIMPLCTYPLHLAFPASTIRHTFCQSRRDLWFRRTKLSGTRWAPCIGVDIGWRCTMYAASSFPLIFLLTALSFRDHKQVNASLLRC